MRFLRHTIMAVLAGVVFAVLCVDGAQRPGDKEVKVKDKAAEAEAVNRLIQKLGSEDFNERERAVKELVETGAPALQALRTAAASEDAEVARRAKVCIPEIERNERVLTVAARLASKSAKERAEAADELMTIGPGAHKAVPALLMTLHDPDSQVRERAIVAISHIGPSAEAAVPKLMQIMQDKREAEDLRWIATVSLGKLGPSARRAVPIVLQLLEAETTNLKNAAVNALGDLGQDDARVVLALVKALDHEHSSVHISAGSALARLRKEPEIAVPAPAGFLKKHKGNPKLDKSRECITRALGSFGPNARLSVPVLIEIVKDEKENCDLRVSAVVTLGTIGPDARDALPILKELLEKENPRAPTAHLIPDVVERIEGRR